MINWKYIRIYVELFIAFFINNRDPGGINYIILYYNIFSNIRKKPL